MDIERERELSWEYNDEIEEEYEFDAAKCFDFTRVETRAESRAAEHWFHFAPSYPPSPFVRRLILREDLLQEHENAALKCNEPVTMALLDDEVDIGMGECSSTVDQVECNSVMETGELDCNIMKGGISEMLESGNLQNQLTGSCFYNPVIKEISEAKPKSSAKPRYPRTSTLMKPTASQLAKQNPRKVADTRNSMHPFGVEVQPAKRQKLEGGLVHKVPDLKPQSNFVHKAPTKDGTTNGLHANLKITIPREPELETAHRAQKTRPKITTEEPERTTFRRFKALPLNKKILEAPGPFLPKRTIPRLPKFQEFHLKTSERAMQHASSVPPSSGSFGNTNKKVLDKSCTRAFAECTSGEPKRSNLADTSKQGVSDFVHSFKARPLNKKIFTSKGVTGVFRNIKKEVTVPLEFNFQTDRRVQSHPPVELFDKLSLAEVQPNTIPQGKPPRPSNIPSKGLKENRVSYFQQEDETKGYSKENQRRVWEKHPQSAKDEINKLGPTYGLRRLDSTPRLRSQGSS